PRAAFTSRSASSSSTFFFFQAEDGIRDLYVTGVQTCALPISYLNRERSWWRFGRDVADQDPAPGIQVGLELAEHADASVRLRDVAVAKPGEDERVVAVLERDGFNPTRREFRVQALPFEHVARQGDGPRGRGDTVD